ncbi:hypothetical protein CHS0354_038603 [Potamilus streckersoni]|uniref:TIR domain-containing protein n=1 Tax=Potamilus streckersoni TaxID=2493646 RepID=A0AAE0TGL9_9BIVA|nr:hypothetical protein CHS0354_038603 [Potamilus streckersoni]
MFFVGLWFASFIEYSALTEIPTLSECQLPCICNIYTNNSINVECFIVNDSHTVIFHNVSLPNHTVSVFISVNTNIIQIPDAPFQESSWNHVLHFKLDGNGKITSWRPSIQTFQFLRSVRYLYLRDAGIRDIEKGTFSELPDLVVLDLSRNKGLHLIDLTNAMVGLSSPNLKVFNVSGVNSLEDTSLFTVDHPFMENLQGTRLIVLDVSWTRIIAFATPFRYYVPYLESFNASGTLLLGQSKCLSEMYVMDSLKELVLDKWPAFTRSRSITRRSITNECIYANSSTNGDCFNSPPNLEILSFIDSTINISYIFERNGRICINPNNKIRRMNLSGVKWTLSKVFSPITGLLHLEDFDISRTSLTNLHQDSFRYFPSLQILNIANLSHNYLQSFELEFHKEALLHLIDLSFNELVVIEPVFGDFISVDLPNWDGFIIYIAGNNLQCSCSLNSLKLITWILSSQSSNHVQLVPPDVTCKYGNNVVKISEEILSVLKGYCIPESPNYILYAVIGIFATSCLGTCILFDIWYCRRRKCITSSRTDSKIHFQNNVGINIIPDSRPDYAVFLSFSSNDKDFVFECMWPKLEKKLKHLLKKENKLVFVGDANFDVGRQICEEVISAASRCWCTVLIISNSFLESDWCLFEVQSAWNSGCRIFPLFIEKCDGRRAKGIMKVVCRDMVRLLWPKDRADLQEQLLDSLCAQIEQHINLHGQSSKDDNK